MHLCFAVGLGKLNERGINSYQKADLLWEESSMRRYVLVWIQVYLLPCFCLTSLMSLFTELEINVEGGQLQMTSRGSALRLRYCDFSSQGRHNSHRSTSLNCFRFIFLQHSLSAFTCCHSSFFQLLYRSYSESVLADIHFNQSGGRTKIVKTSEGHVYRSEFYIYDRCLRLLYLIF